MQAARNTQGYGEMSSHWSDMFSQYLQTEMPQGVLVKGADGADRGKKEQNTNLAAVKPQCSVCRSHMEVFASDNCSWVSCIYHTGALEATLTTLCKMGFPNLPPLLTSEEWHENNTLPVHSSKRNIYKALYLFPKWDYSFELNPSTTCLI